MLNGILDEISKHIHQNKSATFVLTELESKHLKSSDNKLIHDLIKTVSDSFFAQNFLEKSLEANSPSFIICGDTNRVSNIYCSIMTSNGINVLLGAVEGLHFIIAQHVTSCDFIYFPKYNYLHKVAHTSPEKASNVLIILLKLLKARSSEKDITKGSEPLLRGLIMSHGRPYHFFYDCAAMVHKLHEANLLGRLDHFQTVSGNFIDFTELYDLNVLNHVVKFSDINYRSEVDGSIFFKVGLRFNKKNTQVIDLIRGFDRCLMKTVNKLAAVSTKYNEVLKLKEDGYFILWFGVSTDKRSLRNQIDLVLSLVLELKQQHNVCLLVDGWTVADKSYPPAPGVIKQDLDVLKELQNVILDTHIVSLIGEESFQKICIASLVDFHVSSAGTGSLWPSRIAQKKGLMHISHAFRDVSRKGHLHSVDSRYFPSTLIEDIKDIDARMDYISYKVNINETINFFKSNYPVIFTNNFDYNVFNVLKMVDIQCIGITENLYRCVSSKPKIWLDTRSISKIQGAYRLKIIGFIRFYSTSTKGNFSKFYMDFGEGLSEKDKTFIDISQNTGRFEVVIDASKPLKNLRFDIINAEVDFTFHGVFYKIEVINDKKELI